MSLVVLMYPRSASYYDQKFDMHHDVSPKLSPCLTFSYHLKLFLYYLGAMSFRKNLRNCICTNIGEMLCIHVHILK